MAASTAADGIEADDVNERQLRGETRQHQRVRLVRTTASTPMSSMARRQCSDVAGATTTPAWLRRDERRGGTLSTDQRRDFDEFDDAMEVRFISPN
ncbi:hypothetical protein Syun_031560 [Stephania yunnanensis]|uniref:Uncharacterized protein n=1 Tax=Stephania yunnanensis TaxID=152371 RepID=A0AAP0E0R1_9MAGN